MDAQSEKLQEVFDKELENIKSKTELKNTIIEVKYTLEGINSRINEAEEQISSWKTEWWKSLPQEKEKRMKGNEDSLRDLWDNIKCTDIH